MGVFHIFNNFTTYKLYKWYNIVQSFLYVCISNTLMCSVFNFIFIRINLMNFALFPLSLFRFMFIFFKKNTIYTLKKEY